MSCFLRNAAGAEPPEAKYGRRMLGQENSALRSHAFVWGLLRVDVPARLAGLTCWDSDSRSTWEASALHTLYTSTVDLRSGSAGPWNSPLASHNHGWRHCACSSSLIFFSML